MQVVTQNQNNLAFSAAGRCETAVASLWFFLLSVSTLLPRMKGGLVVFCFFFFSFKSKLISETNHKNDVSWKTLTLASAGLTQLILPRFGTDGDRLTSVSKAEWLLCWVPFSVSMCRGLFPVACSAVGIPASAHSLFSLLPLSGLYLH